MLNNGRASEITALGKKWTVGRFELRILREFRKWVLERLDDPTSIDKELFKLLPVEEQLSRVKQAESDKRDLKNFSSNCPLFKRFVATEEGAAEFARLMFSAHHPDMTAELALQIFIEAQDQFAAAVLAAQGSLPGNQ